MATVANLAPGSSVRELTRRLFRRAAAGVGQYDAFISYRHAVDKERAAAVKRALHRIGKPWWKPWAARVFRDEDGLPLTEKLWPTIENALRRSRHLILFASRGAAQQSEWVQRELAVWCALEPRRPLSIVLTDGDIVWSDKDFDWPSSDAVPPILKGFFTDEPHWADLRGIAAADLHLDNADFRREAVKIAGALRGLSPEDMASEDLRQHRRTVTLAWTVAVTMFAAFVGLAIQFFEVRDERWRATEAAKQAVLVSHRERRQARIAHENAKLAEQRRGEAEAAQKEAERQRDDARSQAYAAAAYAWADRDPTLAVSLARNTRDNATAAIALLKAFNTASWLYSHRFDDAWDGDLSPDGRKLLWVESGGKRLHLVDLRTNQSRTLSIDASNARFLPNGNLLVWSGFDDEHITVLSPAGEPIRDHKLRFNEVFICGSRIFVPAFVDGGVAVHLIDPHTGALSSLPVPEIKHLGIRCACAGDRLAMAQTLPGRLVVVSADGARRSVDIPSEYHAYDVDIAGERVAVYLAGAVRDISDAAGWIDIGAPEPRLNIVRLPMSPSFDSGGVTQFLADGRLLAASTDGWTRVVDLNNGIVTAFADRSRAVDDTAVSHDGHVIAVGRRSGVVTLYNTAGLPFGQLLGISHSDGLNSTFDRIVFDPSDSMVLTVVRHEVRLWRKPRYELAFARSGPFGKSDAASQRALTAVAAYHRAGDPSFVACDKALRIDDTGQVSLCVTARGRQDNLNTGVTKPELDIVTSGPLSGYGHRWEGDDVLRLFVLSPGMIRRLLEEESRHGRLWMPNDQIRNAWAPHNDDNPAASSVLSERRRSRSAASRVK
jgi:hypothetical protein